MPLPTFVDHSVLSAAQLNALVTAIPTRLSQLFNDVNYLTSAQGPVTSVSGRSGAITLTYSDIGGLSTVAHTGSFGDLLNTPVIPNNTNQLVNGANFVTASSLTSYAPLVSPALTGAPTAPTQASSDNSTRIATTSFVAALVSSSMASAGAGTVTSVSSANNAISIGTPTTTPVFTFNPANVRTSTLNNDSGFISGAVTSVSSVNNLITVANSTSTVALTFVPAALFTLNTTPTPARASRLLLNDGTITGAVTVANLLGLIQPSDFAGVLAPSGTIVNYFALTGNTTGNQVVFSAVGADTDIDLALASKGAGAITLNGYTYAFGGMQVRQSLTVQSSGSPFYSLHVDGTSGNLLFQNSSFNDLVSFTQNGDITAQGILNNQSGEVKAVRVFTGTGNVTMATTDRYIVVNKATGAATTVTLVASPVKGTVVTIKDGKGDAATNNITVVPAAGNIDGGTNWILNTAYKSVQVIYNGTSWSVA